MSLDTSSQPVTGGYALLASRMRQLGLMRRRPGYYLLLTAATGGAFVAMLVGMFLVSHQWWVVLAAPVAAVLSTQIAFLGHDAAHRQIARSTRTNRILGLVFGDLGNGLSYGWWVNKHNAHHAHPNDLESDPDVAVGAFVFDPDQADQRRGAAAWMTRHQAWLFFPLLLLEALNLHVASVRAVGSGQVKYRRTEALLLTTHLLLYVAVLVSTMTLAQAVAFVVVHQGLFGVYLGCAFAPSHKGMPTLSGAQAEDPLLRQVLTSRNVTGGRAVGWVLGGLNLQIEHHLFPSMPRPNLRKARPVVQEFCREHGVSYAETTAIGAYARALRHLRKVGDPLRRSG